jgi:multicomponent Na+:H+ antiporter subunit D
VSWLLAAPILIPFTTAIVMVLAPLRWLGVAGALALLGAGVVLLLEVVSRGVLAAQVAGWPAPFGISLVADHLSAAMVVITGIIGSAVAVYAIADIDRQRRWFGFDPLYHLLLAATCGAFLTGDLFNLYVWLEVMLIASFALLSLGGGRRQLDGAVKYVSLNLITTAMFLLGVGLLYGVTGTLNMADLHLAVRQADNPGLITAIAVLFLIAVGAKAAVFPLFFWLPAAYHTPPVAISAVFAGLLTKIGVYALIRIFTLIFTHDVGYTHNLILVIAALSMLTGVLGAVAQNEFRRILSFHIVSQIGYMVLGLALHTPLALAGAVFYVVHHIIVKTNLFLISGVARRLGGTFELKSLGGLYASAPLLAFLFLVPAFSLGGLPPLSGFWAKLALIKASLELEAYGIAAMALAVGLLTLFSMSKIWTEAFWKPQPGGSSPAALSPGEATLLLAPIAALATLTIGIGLWPTPLLALAERAAEELLSPEAYVHAVLGAGR